MIYIISIIFIYLINNFFKKKKFLINNTGQLHQKLSEEKTIPLTGGLFLSFYFIIYFHNQFNFIIFFLTLFLIGVATDLEIIKSPLKRIIIQISFVFLFILYFDLSIYDLRVEKINFLLENKYFSFFFTTLCFLVLINGSNFIDGNNGITIGYYLIIFIILLSLSNHSNIKLEKDLVINLSIFLSILLIFNLLNFFYLGDSGVYLISVFSGYFLINFINQNNNISPYFVANLFWYPVFELLFSMIRKLKNKFSPLKPDTNHLHQMIFKNLNNQFIYQKNYINSLTGLLINFYNFMILYICSINYSSTNLQVMLMLFNILVYLFVYYLLKKIRFSRT